MSELIAPHGGRLQTLILPEGERVSEMHAARDYPSWDLSPRQVHDLELLMTGGFSPLNGFLGREDYERVCAEMRLADGTLWPLPVVLDVTEAFASTLDAGARVALRDPEGVLLAVLEVSDVWRPDREREAHQLFDTADEAHPGARTLLQQSHPFYVGGRVLGIELPIHYDFRSVRYTPTQLRQTFDRLGWRRIVAFHTCSPIHRAQRELTFRAAQIIEANLLIHAAAGVARASDIDHFTRMRCYERVLKTYPEQTTLLGLVPLNSRMAGARETLWHAIIRKNFGCSHFIVGSGGDEPFHDADAALAKRYEDELEIGIVPLQDVGYVPEKGRYLPLDEVGREDTVLQISASDFHRRLRDGLDIPAWFSYPDVIEELQRSWPPRHRQGFTVFFTGLSGAGKSTIANALMVKLLEMGGRPVTLLDGDIVRKHLSSELGFSREHRDLNILRIGFVASEITKNRGIAICAPIAPYRATRRAVREMVEAVGGFIEVHVATPLQVCEQRDRKGLYAKARAGIIRGFTGIDDPYEEPEQPEIRLDTRTIPADEAAQNIILKLENLGFVR